MKAVLFDLDDTLFDHQHCYRQALQSVYDHYQPLQAKGFSGLEAVYQTILEAFHARAVAGEITLKQARALRMQAIFADYGMDITIEQAQQIDVDYYRYAYLTARRSVPGARELLEKIRERGLTIGIITNHVLDEQMDKLAAIDLTDLVDVVIAAGEVGVSKPDPPIFHVLLDAVQCRPNETVLIGDSWHSDVIGATNVGIRAIWLNRYGDMCPDASLAKEIHALEPVEGVLKLIFDN